MAGRPLGGPHYLLLCWSTATLLVGGTVESSLSSFHDFSFRNAARPRYDGCCFGTNSLACSLREGLRDGAAERIAVPRSPRDETE
jgi:hypothetical protein